MGTLTGDIPPSTVSFQFVDTLGEFVMEDCNDWTTSDEYSVSTCLGENRKLIK